MNKNLKRRIRVKAHIRRRVFGTSERPRLTVFRSNAQIYAQVIDDRLGKTLASASSLAIKDQMTKSEKAAKVGELLAQKAKEAGVTTVVFDRNGYLYHGRVKQLAVAARKGGLDF